MSAKYQAWLMNDPVYGTGIMLVIGGTRYDAVCALAKLNGEIPPADPEINNSHGCVLECIGHKRFCIWFPQKVVTLSTFVHEINHASLLMLHLSGVNAPNWTTGDEHFTYLSGWLARKINEKVKVTKDRPEDKIWKDGQWSK